MNTSYSTPRLFLATLPERNDLIGMHIPQGGQVREIPITTISELKHPFPITVPTRCARVVLSLVSRERECQLLLRLLLRLRLGLVICRSEVGKDGLWGLLLLLRGVSLECIKPIR